MPRFLDSLPPLLARAVRSLRPGAPTSTARSAVRDLPTAERSRWIAYAPDPDSCADPGEIVWAWVPFEEHDGRGKDRPLLVVGRDGAGGQAAGPLRLELTPSSRTGV